MRSFAIRARSTALSTRTARQKSAKDMLARESPAIQEGPGNKVTIPCQRYPDDLVYVYIHKSMKMLPDGSWGSSVLGLFGPFFLWCAPAPDPGSVAFLAPERS